MSCCLRTERKSVTDLDVMMDEALDTSSNNVLEIESSEEQLCFNVDHWEDELIENHIN